MMKTVLETERLLLKACSGQDPKEALDVLDYAIRNRSFLEPWEMSRGQEYYTLEHQARLLAEEARKRRDGVLFRVWLYTKGANGRLIGSAALSNIVGGAFKSCHLGYKLDGEEAGKGYMTEALWPVIEYAFAELGLHRIEANIMPRNKASLGVVRKLGFYEEGLAFKYLLINGVWEDHLHMVLRNENME